MEQKQETKAGTITKLITSKGYGFIRKDTDKKDIFFHASRVVSPEYEQLHEGNKVEFMELQTDKGLTAIDIVVMDK